MSPRMARLSRHARLLYLLALFQLVGGPLVLCGVMMFVRLAAEKDVSLTQQVARAIESAQRMEQGNGPEAILVQVAGLPTSAKSAVPVPVKTKEGKIKLVGVSEFFSGVQLSVPCALWQPLQRWHDPAPVTQAQAPPLPPPRVV